MIKNGDANGGIKLVNTLVNAGNPALLIQSSESTAAQLRIADMSGKYYTAEQ